MVVGELGSGPISKYLHLEDSPPASLGRFQSLSSGLEGRDVHPVLGRGQLSGLCLSRTLFSINLVVVDEVAEVTWQKQWRGGLQKNPSAWPVSRASLWHAVLYGEDPWEFRTQQSWLGRDPPSVRRVRVERLSCPSACCLTQD